MDNIDIIKRKIYHLFVSGVINYNDIDLLSQLSFNDLYKFNQDSFKNRVMLSIYINPYLLCNDNLINQDDFNFDIISNLVIKRYNEEIEEYNIRLVSKDISYIEYHNKIMALHTLYFISSVIGMRIESIYRNKICESINQKNY